MLQGHAHNLEKKKKTVGFLMVAANSLHVCMAEYTIPFLTFYGGIKNVAAIWKHLPSESQA